MKKTGKTTRKVDNSIQDLFNKGVAYLYEGRHKDASHHINALSIFSNRMLSEHPKTKYTYEYGCWDGVWCYKIQTHNL